jgi:allantoinase
MPETGPLDLVIKNVRLVRPAHPDVVRVDVGVRHGRFAQINPDIPVTDARQVYDGRGWLAFPGVVDAHTHAGIHAPLAMTPSARAAPP